MSHNLQRNVNDLVTLATYGNVPEADLAKAVLEERGISAQLSGDGMATTLWHLGAAMGGVQLQVDQADIDAANEILQSVIARPDESPTGEAWKCSACNSVVDAGFEVCWSCGALVEEASETMAAEDLSPNDVPTSSADQIVSRAWRTTIFGLMFPPILLYALALTFKITRDELSPAGRKKFDKTLACLIVFFGAWGLVFFG